MTTATNTSGLRPRRGLHHLLAGASLLLGGVAVATGTLLPLAYRGPYEDPPGVTHTDHVTVVLTFNPQSGASIGNQVFADLVTLVIFLGPALVFALLGVRWLRGRPSPRVGIWLSTFFGVLLLCIAGGGIATLYALLLRFTDSGIRTGFDVGLYVVWAGYGSALLGVLLAIP